MYSYKHKLFLRRIRRKKIFIITFQLLILSIFILLWQFLSDHGYINSFIGSSPKRVLQTLIKLYNSGDLLKHIYITCLETIISFSLATVIGIIIASIYWLFPIIHKICEPYLTIMNSLPKIALGPIIIIWVGAKMSSIIVMALLISLILTIINVHHSFVNTDYNKIKLLKSFNASNYQIYRYLIFPGNISGIINALKVNISMSLIGVIMGEFLVSKEGIGYLIMYGSQVFNLNLVISGIIVLCFVATVMFLIINFIENKLIKNKR